MHTDRAASIVTTFAWNGRHEELCNLAAYPMADGAAYINGEVVTSDLPSPNQSPEKEKGSEPFSRF